MIPEMFFWLFGSFVFWSVVCIPDFVKDLPEKKKEEYMALYNQQKELTRKEFYDLCENWAQKQDAKIKRKFRQYRLQEERYIEKRDRILRAKLDMVEGKQGAKEFLLKLLDIQKDMNIPLKKYEAEEEEMRHTISPQLLEEATKIWNLLDPAHIP